RAAADAQKVDRLQEEQRLAARALLDDLDQALEAVEKAIVAHAQQRTGRHVADAGRLDDDDARAAVGEAAIPVEHLGRDGAVVGGAPRDHRRHPGSLARLERADANGAEPARARRLLRRRPAHEGKRVLDPFRRGPHWLNQSYLGSSFLASAL